jgi:hypothetical protein
MAPTSKFRLAAAVTVALGVPAALVAACSSNNSNPAPNTPVVYTVSDSGEDSPTSTTGPDGGVVTTPDGSTVPPTGDAGTADAPSDAQATVCTSQQTDAGCWICPSQTPTSNEFLNQCNGTGVHCSPYSNAANIPGYDGGPLLWSN